MKSFSFPGALTVLAVCAAVGMAGSAQGAESTALGSAGFQASPAQPVGWRGDGTGHFPGATPPLTWGRARGGGGYEAKGIVWATQMPAGGISSPIVVGDRVFVTTEGCDLVCADKATGKLLWIHSNLEFEGLPEDELKTAPAFAEELPQLAGRLEQANAAVVQEINAQQATGATSAYRALASVKAKKNLEDQIQKIMTGISKKYDHAWPQGVYGYCTETPVSDGKNVYAYIATGVSVCYDFSGKRKWIVAGASGGEEKGNYTAPLILGGKFIVWGRPDMRAYNAETGKLAWSLKVDGANASSLYGVRSGNDLVAGFRNYFVRVSDGKPIWGSKNVDNGTQTPVISGDTVVMWLGGDKGGLKAFKIPGDTEGGKLMTAMSYKTDWAGEPATSKEHPFEQGIVASPLIVDGLIYRICSGGGLMVNDGSTGEILYRKMLPMKPKTAYWAWGGAAVSPSFAGKNIYIMDNQGTTVVIQPGREYKELAVNRIEDRKDGNEQVQNLAQPFFEGSRMYYRTPDLLLCIGEK